MKTRMINACRTSMVEPSTWCVSGVFIALVVLSAAKISQSDELEEEAAGIAERNRTEIEHAIAATEFHINILEARGSDESDRAYRSAWKELQLQTGEAARSPIELGELIALELRPEDELIGIGVIVDEARQEARKSADTFYEEDQLLEQWHKEHPEVKARINDLLELRRTEENRRDKEQAIAAAREPIPEELPPGIMDMPEAEQLSIIGAMLSRVSEYFHKLHPDLLVADAAYAEWRQSNRDLVDRVAQLSDARISKGVLPTIDVPDAPPHLADAFQTAVTTLNQQEAEDEADRDEGGYFSNEVLARRENRRMEFYESMRPLNREISLYRLKQQKQQLEQQLEKQ